MGFASEIPFQFIVLFINTPPILLFIWQHCDSQIACAAYVQLALVEGALARPKQGVLARSESSVAAVPRVDHFAFRVDLEDCELFRHLFLPLDVSDASDVSVVRFKLA